LPCPLTLHRIGGVRNALIISSLFVIACTPAAPVITTPVAIPAEQPDPLRREGETRLRNVRQLTFGGENAEAYFSPDGTKLIFQSTRDGFECDQIYEMIVDGSGVRLLSSGEGRTTCAYYIPGTSDIIYASTHASGKECPPPPDRARGYVWRLYDSFDIYRADGDGGNLRPLTSTPGYDAEPTVSADGKKIVFTSLRDGDIDIYSMNTDGSDVRRLTSETGYDGGPFYSRDGEWIVYRASRPKTEAEMEDYQTLLREGLLRPGNLEIWVMRADGSDKRQVTSNGAANFAPYFTPDGRRIIFSSNLHNPRGRNFDLFLVNVDGTGLEQVTFEETFDGFPMFSPDGTKLVFSSNRNAAIEGETNVFIAEWVD
jgi:TolB protein